MSMRAETRKIALFVPCLVDAVYPEVAEAAVYVLRKAGVEPTYPEGQTCCGQPAFNAGYRNEARKAAAHFLDVFSGNDPIVCPSGSCVAMVRHQFETLFQDDPDRLSQARQTAQRTFEFTEYLVDVLGVRDVGASFPGKVTYHDSCHLLRGLRIQEQPRQLIQAVAGIEFVEMQDSDYCCGFGGSFSVKYAEISAALLEDKVENIVRSGADTVVGCDMGCLMNIEGMIHRKGLPIRTMHIAQLLAH